MKLGRVYEGYFDFLALGHFSAATGHPCEDHGLDDIVTERWLREICPRTRLLEDDEDRKRIVVELFVSEEPGDRLKSR